MIISTIKYAQTLPYIFMTAKRKNHKVHKVLTTKETSTITMILTSTALLHILWAFSENQYQI